MKLVQCWIEHPIKQIDQTYTYITELDVEQGTRVFVNFNHKDVIGFVESVEETDETLEEVENRLGIKLKPIISVLDEDPLITTELHDLALWMRDTTLSTAISCFQALLPGKIKPQTNHHKIVMENWVVPSEEEVSLTPKQLEAYMFVLENQKMLYSDLRKKYPTQAKQLLDKGAIVKVVEEKKAKQEKIDVISSDLPLTDLQQKTFQEIIDSNDDVFLLKGVTGSGKTEVYLQLARNAINQGKQVLILVPEIALTPQMIQRVSSRFGSILAIYHSGLNPQEKYEQYQKVKNGEASIVVGTRSAVFLPFHQLGLIVMDEEHDASYKQDSQPSYHARDIAIYRGKYHHCKVILGSATPSLESYARAIKSVYHLVEMNERINHALPKVSTISMKDCIKKGQSYILSDPLKEKIQEKIDHHEQIILLLNRRGYHTRLRCKSCNEMIMCPHCDLAMSYHRDDHLLKCHTCGTTMKVPRVCPKCGSVEGFTNLGYGTQKLEDELQIAFPTAKILRMDADTTSKKNAHEKILQKFANHEADILVGTQMIAKGLDFASVTLVGILNGDEGLNRTDYRSCEMTFDLLMQASGRSGRSDKTGEVVLQVFDPNHYAVQCAARQDYDSFFQREMQFRHAGMYPPYTYMISLTVSGKSQKEVDDIALQLKQGLNGNYKTLGILSLLRIQDRYRNQIILKGRNLDEMRFDIRKLLEKEERLRTKDIRINVNPLSMD